MRETYQRKKRGQYELSQQSQNIRHRRAAQTRRGLSAFRRRRRARHVPERGVELQVLSLRDAAQHEPVLVGQDRGAFQLATQGLRQAHLHKHPLSLPHLHESLQAARHRRQGQHLRRVYAHLRARSGGGQGAPRIRRQQRRGSVRQRSVRGILGVQLRLSGVRHHRPRQARRQRAQDRSLPLHHGQLSRGSGHVASLRHFP